jgi:lipopolysaccharide/colanic/teichoic acid biosynthesis glycosyltransferase
MGDMSLVGPRPELPRYVALYTPAQRRVLEVSPGITDLASLIFHNEEQILAGVDDPLAYYESTLIPRKLVLSLEGVKHMSLGYDLKLIAMTVLCITLRRRQGILPIGFDQQG